ncbi:hypothetical protein ACFC58_36350 [Kitasatospora purpeofusca]|uniref:hypothetical protein n=1 Tax=Kitasatospora purpeofusca TaxID=67352 RepID=UPI0035E33FB1
MPHHTPVIQQSTYTRAGMWWAHCCRSIVERPDHTSWCATKEDAQALADWHTAGEIGPAPVGAVVPAEAEEPLQLDLFA